MEAHFASLFSEIFLDFTENKVLNILKAKDNVIMEPFLDNSELFNWIFRAFNKVMEKNLRQKFLSCRQFSSF